MNTLIEKKTDGPSEIAITSVSAPVSTNNYADSKETQAEVLDDLVRKLTVLEIEAALMRRLNE